jgi:phage shock protein PspC (stress-responsive transcriptional regulator)
MGAAIAGHLANAGIPSSLLDIVPGELTAEEQVAGAKLTDRKVRNRIAQGGYDRMVKANPSNLFVKRGAGLISGLNGVRYNFVTANWGSPTVPPSTGLQVEFEANGPDATHIFPAQGHASGASSGDFYRSSDNVIVSGVCAGLAHKWNTDPVIIRIAMVFIPFGWIFYIIGSMSWSARTTR